MVTDCKAFNHHLKFNSMVSVCVCNVYNCRTPTCDGDTLCVRAAAAHAVGVQVCVGLDTVFRSLLQGGDVEIFLVHRNDMCFSLREREQGEFNVVSN